MSAGSGPDRAAPFDEVPVTVTGAIDVLRHQGYTANFELVDGALRTDDGISQCAIDEAIVERQYRFEGPSDPGDEMIVFGLLDPTTDVRGTLAAAYGPLADPELFEHISRLSARVD